MKKRFALALGLALSAGAHAHTDEMLDQMQAPHGGQLRMSGPYHYELVLKSDRVEVYVTDHAGTASAIAGATGTATVIAGKTKQRVALKPAEANRLSGPGSFDPQAPTQAVVSLSFPQLGGFDARFELNQAQKHGHHEHEHGHSH